MPTPMTASPVAPAARASAADWFDEVMQPDRPFRKVTVHPDRLVADACALAEARCDLPNLLARGYPLRVHTFARLEALAHMLDGASRAARVEAASVAWPEVTKRRVREGLSSIRRQLVAIARAADGVDEWTLLSAPPANLGLATLVSDMGDVLRTAEALGPSLPDAPFVADLIVLGRRLIAQYDEAQAACAEARRRRTLFVNARDRLAAALYEDLMTVSRCGLAAYRHDPERARPYRLEHTRGAKARRRPAPSEGS